MLREGEQEVKLPVAAPPLPPSGGSDDDWETQEDPSARAMAALSVDAAAQAMGKMRIMQPPPLPAQDGGAYERVLFDPSSAHAQPVSAATASAAAASALDGGHGPMDPVLVACLENPRERLTLLKFEDQIVRFIKNPRESQLVFPPLSSYHRLIIHRLAERCCLEHQTAEYNPYAGGNGGYDGNSSRAVTLFRTSQSIVPSVLLIDLSSDRQQQTVTPATAPKIMMRKRGAQTGVNGGKNPGDAKNAQRSMQDREKAYAEARARIFGEDTGAEPTSSSASSNSSPSAAASANTSGESSLSGAGAKLHYSNNQQAAGPDGSRGFGGRGGAAAGRGPGGQVNKPQQRQDIADAQDRADSSDSAASTTSTGAPRAQSTKNWKESKVLWRNREQEMNDPDFTRNRDAYRPSRNNSNNASEYSRYPHPQAQQQQMGRYPAPQMDYYSQQQQPPLPSRRFPPGGEYNRIDNTGMMRPPPPPDHFRSGGAAGGFSMNTPPLPPPPPAAGAGGRGGYGYNNSPHGRQYQHQHSSPSPVRGARNGGGYNDDFPPLGK
ncbi:hypothetical protein Gpo141_00004171 [Globisporangium polare]